MRSGSGGSAARTASGTSRPCAHRLAHDEPEAVDEAAQRRGDVGVGGGDRRVLALLGRRAVERRVPGTAEQRRRLVDEGEVARVGAVEARGRGRRSGTSSGHSTPRPRAARRNRATASSVGAGIVRRMPTPASSIIVAAAMPVSSETWAFHSSAGDGRAELEGEAAAVAGGHLLLGHRQARATARPLLGDAALPDLAEHAGTARRRCRRRPPPAPWRSRAARRCAPSRGGPRPRSAPPRRRAAGPTRRRGARHPAAGSRPPRSAPPGAAAPARRGSRPSARARA